MLPQSLDCEISDGGTDDGIDSNLEPDNFASETNRLMGYLGLIFLWSSIEC
jgi:hypothetical protein